MSFNSLEYAILFAVAFSGNWLLANRPRLRVWFLLATSYVFYASWVPTYLGLIVFSSTLDFLVGRHLHNTRHRIARKLLLVTSLVVNLGILGTFKYFNFFAAEITRLAAVFGLDVTPFFLNVLLPVGISFYTFQSLSYTIDIYRRRLDPVSSYPQYLLFVAFFPQLVAGPIVRAGTLLPQLVRPPRITASQGSAAIFLIGTGLIKKVAIADFLGMHMVDPVFSNPHMYSSIETLAATYAYAFQIYADFSAYSDIAIGSAALLGIHLPLNFNTPYRAANLREFWQRWHISLSTWLRDYLYIPLGGSRSGPVRTHINLLLTMIIGGLWHGAALTFVLWGTIHGLALVATRIVQRSRFSTRVSPRVRRLLGIVVTFHVVCAAWVFFRSPDITHAISIFRTIFAGTGGTTNLQWTAGIVLVLAVAAHWFPDNWYRHVKAFFDVIPGPLQATAMIGVIVALNHIASTDVTPFIYFQF